LLRSGAEIFQAHKADPNAANTAFAAVSALAPGIAASSHVTALKSFADSNPDAVASGVAALGSGVKKGFGRLQSRLGFGRRPAAAEQPHPTQQPQPTEQSQPTEHAQPSQPAENAQPVQPSQPAQQTETISQPQAV
jgi:hypothetical protein